MWGEGKGRELGGDLYPYGHNWALQLRNMCLLTTSREQHGKESCSYILLRHSYLKQGVP